jgi:hypothetical protein
MLADIFLMLNKHARMKLMNKLCNIIEITLLLENVCLHRDTRNFKDILKIANTFCRQIISNNGVLTIDKKTLLLFDRYNKTIKKIHSQNLNSLKCELSDTGSEKSCDEDDHEDDTEDE